MSAAAKIRSQTSEHMDRWVEIAKLGRGHKKLRPLCAMIDCEHQRRKGFQTCSSECGERFRRMQSDRANRLRFADPQAREMVARRNRDMWSDPTMREKIKSGVQKFLENPIAVASRRRRFLETFDRAAAGERLRTRFQSNPELRQSQIDSVRLWYIPKEIRRQLSNVEKLLLSDPDTRRAIIASVQAAVEPQECILDMSENMEIVGHVLGKKNAALLLGEIRKLEQSLGRLPSDEEIVEAARMPESPIHLLVFDKDEREAAEAYYVARVQYLMRSLLALETTQDGEKASFRLFVRTKDGYSKVTEISPGSATASSIAAKLAADIESAIRRAKAWETFQQDAVSRRAAKKLVGHLERAADLVSPRQAHGAA